MSYPPGPEGQQPYPPYQPQPKRKRHVGRIILISLSGVLVLLAGLIAIGIAAGGGKTPRQAGNAAANSTFTPAPAVTLATPAPAPSPDGTYQGACSYTLGNDPAGSPGTAVATGDIQTTNTGNIGEVIRLTITWPQQGYSPLVKTKWVRLAKGASQDVQFNHPMTSNEVDNLQNWQTGHNYADGCTYKATITTTYGNPS